MIFQTSACGKIILFGEHAVVYGQPAMALPVRGLRARASFEPGDSELFLRAPDIQLESPLSRLPDHHPLALCIRSACRYAGLHPPSGTLTVNSDIPIASGLGSGAALSTAIVRVIVKSAGREIPAEETSALVYEVEKVYHGNPSGVDNTVIAHEQPVWFVRGQTPVRLSPARSFRWLIADSGVRSSTRTAVEGVGRRREADSVRYDAAFREMGRLAERGRAALETGDPAGLGEAMTAAQSQLKNIGVSTPVLESLSTAACSAGALGAKLSGAGLGGNIIALVEPAVESAVRAALLQAGAVRVFSTEVDPLP